MSLADRVLLDVANRRQLGAELTRAVTGLEFTGAMDSCPTLTATIEDPDLELMDSRLLVRGSQRELGSPAGYTLRPIDLAYDGIAYRLAAAKHEDRATQLVFEHRGVAYMREHDSPLSASRSATTRALFIRRQVDEVGRRRRAPHRLAFWAPEVSRRMPIARADDELASGAEPQRDSSAVVNRASSLKGHAIKGAKLNAEQRRNATILLDEAETLGAGPKATLALMLAGAEESGYRAIPNAGGSKYAGVLQADPANVPQSATRKQAHYFLKGGKGFQGGGAIALARRNPGKSAAWIALTVQGSISNFGGDVAKGERFYDAHRREVEKIIDAAGGESPTPGGGGSYVKSYRFRRDKGEDAWECTGRLADEVNRRRFVTHLARRQDVFIYSDDRHLLDLPVQMRVDPDDPAVTRFDYDLDYGKTARTLSINLLRPDDDEDFGLVPWGLPIIVEGDHPAAGRWLVWSLHETDDSREVELELRQPTPAKLEPAAERVQRNDPADSPSESDDPDVSAVYSRAFAISERNLPYVWGGGHVHAGRADRGTGRDPGTGFDCSGYVAACLLAGGMLPDEWKQGVPDSGTFAREWGKPGKGHALTLWANGGHVFLEVHLKGKRGKWIDTSRQAGGPSGPHLRYGERSTAGFTARHWTGHVKAPTKHRRKKPEPKKTV